MNEQYVEKIKLDFPIFKSFSGEKQLYYLDNAAITQVPNCVIQALTDFYKNFNSNVHRGAYFISEKATEEYELAREKISTYIGCKNKAQCIFVKNTTEGINLIANSFLLPNLKKNDEVVISQMEHHSNIVPWYILFKKGKIKLKVIPILQNGDINYDALNSLLTENTKLLSLTHISNAIGTINDIKKIITIAHSKNIPVLVDAAQTFSNDIINVENLDCDFLVTSAHKMYGPNGIGLLYIKKQFLNKIEPYQGGGEMIKYVDFENVIWNDPPYKFEAGTQSIANAIAFGHVIDFLKKIDYSKCMEYKEELTNYALNRLSNIKNLNIIANPKKRASIISFTIDGIHSHDFGTIANHYGVCVRTGHHCAMPLMAFYNVSSTIRLSLGIYNTKKDIDRLVYSVIEAKKIFC